MKSDSDPYVALRQIKARISANAINVNLINCVLDKVRLMPSIMYAPPSTLAIEHELKLMEDDVKALIQQAQKVVWMLRDDNVTLANELEQSVKNIEQECPELAHYIKRQGNHAT